MCGDSTLRLVERSQHKHIFSVSRKVLRAWHLSIEKTKITLFSAFKKLNIFKLIRHRSYILLLLRLSLSACSKPKTAPTKATKKISCLSIALCRTHCLLQIQILHVEKHAVPCFHTITKINFNEDLCNYSINKCSAEWLPCSLGVNFRGQSIASQSRSTR